MSELFKENGVGVIFGFFNFCFGAYNIKAENFRTIDYILEKALFKLNKFINVPKNIKFYFLGKELNNKSEKIGNIFPHREKVTIKLKLPSNENNNIINKKIIPRKLFFHKAIEEIKLPLIPKNKSIFLFKRKK